MPYHSPGEVLNDATHDVEFRSILEQPNKPMLSKRKLVKPVAALLIIGAVLVGVFWPKGKGHWSGDADLAIVVRVLDQQGGAIANARVELIRLGDSTTVEGSAVTNDLGFALLSHTFSAGGEFGKGWTWATVDTHHYSVRVTVDGVSPWMCRLSRHVPRRFEDFDKPYLASVIMRVGDKDDS